MRRTRRTDETQAEYEAAMKTEVEDPSPLADHVTVEPDPTDPNRSGPTGPGPGHDSVTPARRKGDS
jgi:hypothetical protein